MRLSIPKLEILLVEIENYFRDSAVQAWPRDTTKQTNKKDCMTTQDPTTIEHEDPTNKNEVPAITQGEAPTITDNGEPAKSTEEVSQSTASPEPSTEQDKPQADVAQKANPKDDPDDDYPEPYPMGEELKSQFNVINACIGEINNIVWLAGAEGCLVGREIQLQDLLGEFERACVQVELAIELNARQKQTEDLVALDAFAKARGYPDWAAMQKTLDYDTEPEQGANSVVTPTRKRSVKDQPKVFKWVLREGAPNVTADDPPGYVRLPKELQDSGKYRLAKPSEIKQFEADLAKWRADQCAPKKP